MKMDVGKHIGDKIKYYRKQKGLTQDDLAKKLGLVKGTISNYETGYRTPQETRLFELTDILEISMNDLFPQTTSGNKKSEDIHNHRNKLTYNTNRPNSLPNSGKIISSVPNYTVEDMVESTTAPSDKRSTDEFVYIEVKSDSMDKQFPIGSYALVDTNSSIINGDIVIVKVNRNETILEQVKLDREKEQIILMPNSYDEEHKPTVIDSKKYEAILVGKVVGIYQSV